MKRRQGNESHLYLLTLRGYALKKKKKNICSCTPVTDDPFLMKLDEDEVEKN